MGGVYVSAFLELAAERLDGCEGGVDGLGDEGVFSVVDDDDFVLSVRGWFFDEVELKGLALLISHLKPW
jgi:hypothetical protein